MQAWFSSNVRTALDGSVNISRQYVKEQFARIIIDAAEISDGIQLDRSLRDGQGNIQLGLMFAKLESMTRDRGLAGSFLVDSHGTLLGSSSKLKFSTALTPSTGDISDARHGNPVVGADARTGLVRA